MAQLKPGAISARSSWSLLLYLAAAATACGGRILQARAQPDSNGFISIDCGFTGSSYVDVTANTKLLYNSDDAFTDTGENRNIGPQPPRLLKILQDLRMFPSGKRNCYTLKSLTAGNKYLIRASFEYGNYDGFDKPPVFDLYIGVNFWTTVDMRNVLSTMYSLKEAIVVVPDDFVQVCLVNTGRGTPFISGLELRPLKSSLYPQVNATQGLNLRSRKNFGPSNTDFIVRYPDDPYDRIWGSWMNTSFWNATSTENMVRNDDNDEFEPPSKVMQWAVTPRIASDNIRFTSDVDPQPNDVGCLLVFYFSELEFLLSKAVRQFNVSVNNFVLAQGYFSPQYLYSGYVYGTWLRCSKYNVAIDATANSTLPPIINAYEVFHMISTANIGTDSRDVSAIMAIKVKYGVTNNWTGDPCLPDTLAWTGLTCSPNVSGPPRITCVNMSFSSLNGDISPAFANLTALECMDMSYNNLTGSIPDALSQLPSLTVLDLTGNNLSGSIPPGLLKKIQAGSLSLKYGNNPNLCVDDGGACRTAEMKSKLAIYIAVPLALALVVVSVVVLIFLLRWKRHGWVNKMSTRHVPTGDVHRSLRLENRRFTNNELVMITNNFQHVIGRGGFGYVYNGFLEDGTQVAVKLRSESSSQGVKEFLTEAQILTRIHHKNLVSMIGYCNDGDYMALVYEYMPEGSLQENIARKHLTWRQRLQIALESAQGLEYLHKGCNPPVIHRDVKTTNILLNAKLEAKVADFGMSRAFNRGIYTHISTNTLVGTPGYVDPEYQATLQPTTKSDVFSFGVMLLELISGKPAILQDLPESISIVKWVQQRLSRGEIENVVDERMSGDFDINSVWKAADIALKCTAQASTERPTMTEVVAQLQECLELEGGTAGSNGTQSFFSGSRGDPNFSYNTNAPSASASRNSAAFEALEMMGTGPSTR